MSPARRSRRIFRIWGSQAKVVMTAARAPMISMDEDKGATLEAALMVRRNICQSGRDGGSRNRRWTNRRDAENHHGGACPAIGRFHGSNERAGPDRGPKKQSAPGFLPAPPCLIRTLMTAPPPREAERRIGLILTVQTIAVP